ncbi:RNA polymerase sigma factor [Butyricicoccus sp. Marseille-Q5471]|uniref:RNA polymerase sigma factor n=1 Tax=Butyricicoccus sp. Marseille-Q5471 TaxID=3039493 RepID=UPI0024BCE132|nr:sigma factor-like helix-turn-helix DNA-binding protein [Butyricicoccus sp. Marseille-Q5471]
MPNNEDRPQIKKHYIYDPATKQRIPVSDEVYNEFYRPIWNTFRKAHRHGCCSCPGSKWWLCGGDCAVCKYHTAGDSLSLDYEREVVGDIREDESTDIDSIVIDRIIFAQLLKRLDELMPEARRIGELRLDGLSDSDIADITGIPRTTFLSRLKKAKAKLHAEYSDLI